MSDVRTLLGLAIALLTLSACGGGCDPCGPATYKIGGTINGLVGSRLTLSNNGQTVSIAPALNGQVPELFANLADGASYAITVTTQPTTPSQTCVVANGQGTIAAANITDVSVTCTTTPARFLLGQYPCIAASAIDSTTGALTPITPSYACPSGGEGLPTPMAVEPQGKFLYSATPNGQIGYVSRFAIDRDSGTVTYIDQPEDVLEIEGVTVDPAGKFLFAYSRGLAGMGCICAATIDPVSGTLTFPSGGGYRYTDDALGPVVVDPLGRFVYAVSSNGVMAMSFNSTTGALSPLASPITVAGGAWMIAHPQGEFLYVGTASKVAAFKVDSATGSLTPVTGSPPLAGDSFDSAAVDPSGNYLYVANYSANTISAYAIDRSSGQLTPVSGSPFPTRQVPVGIAIEPLGHFLYVSSDSIGAPGVSAYQIGPSGALTEISGSPFTAAFGGYMVFSY